MGELNNLEEQMRLMLFLIENNDSYTVPDQVWAAENEEEATKLYQADQDYAVLRAIRVLRFIGMAEPDIKKGRVRALH